MAWIESNQELGRHPKTKRFARMANISIPAAIGYLHLLWWWALDFAQDGDISRYDAHDIADALLWDGDGNDLVNALCGAGFIDRDEENSTMYIHDWCDYAGRLIDKREANKTRMRTARAQRVQRTCNAHQRTDDARAGATVPNSTVPNSTKDIPPLSPTGEADASDTEPSSPPAKPKQTKVPYVAGFDAFWCAYPRKVSKPQAQKAWSSLRPDDGLQATILRAVAASRDSPQWQRDGGQFIPHPATWLNQRRWEDEVPSGVVPAWCTQKAKKENPFAASLRRMAEGD